MSKRPVTPEDEISHFKMRLEDEIEATPGPAAADDVRLEKLSTRVTMISILIPVLIVVVLVITYLDIKARVTKTEDTGTMSLQSLSQEVESRFSSLSVRQAALEETVARITDESSKSLAAVQIKLKSISDSLAQIKETAAAKTELKNVGAEVKAAASDLTNKIGNVAGAVEEVQTSLAKVTGDMQGLKTEFNDGLSASKGQLTKIEERTAALQREKIDKASMDLALRLETLKVEQQLKSRIEALQAQLDALEKKLAQRPPAAQVSSSAPGAGGTTPARPSSVAPPPSQATPAQPLARPTTPSSSPGIEEQTIKP